MRKSPITKKSIAYRLERLSMPEPNSGCRLWLGFCMGTGYARVNYRGTMAAAHRVAYELERGPIPPGLSLDHLCRVRCCINPNHLEPVTQKENVLRGSGPTAINAQKKECVAGHILEGANVYVPLGRPGTRTCRICAIKKYVAIQASKGRTVRHTPETEMILATYAKRLEHTHE